MGLRGEYMRNLDYDRLLDDWADLIFKEMDEAKVIFNSEPFGSPKFYTSKGYEDGLCMAMALLGTLETRKRKKYEIDMGKGEIKNEEL
jgi:hypothetical protein